MKVVELVTEHVAYGWSPEELHVQHPYLSLGQIHAALGYYGDHHDEMDAEIAERGTRVERLWESVSAPDIVQRRRLRAPAGSGRAGAGGARERRPVDNRPT